MSRLSKARRKPYEGFFRSLLVAAKILIPACYLLS